MDTQRRLFHEENEEVASTVGALGKAIREQGRFAEAEPWLRKSLAIRESKTPDDWRTFFTRSYLGCLLVDMEHYPEAESLLRSGYDGMKQREKDIPSGSGPRIELALKGLVRLYEVTHRPEQADEWRRRLAEFGTTDADRSLAGK